MDDYLDVELPIGPAALPEWQARRPGQKCWRAHVIDTAKRPATRAKRIAALDGGLKAVA